jgi:hypothetical protein
LPASVAAGQGVSGTPNASGGGGAGQNPFWVASNLYAEKIATLTQQLSANIPNFFQLINPGNFMRGVRFLVRTSTIGVTAGTTAQDNPFNAIQSLDLENVDGGEIMYPMNGWSYAVSQAMFRPWVLPPWDSYDFAASTISPSFSLFLQPEIRQTACVLSNTDARSQYKYNLFLNTNAALGGATTAPFLTITTYLDAWAQPDPQDLQGTPNQPLPPGLALQTKRRHQAGVTFQPAGSDNIIQLTNTGNALRGIIAITRDSSGNRRNLMTDPIRWQQDNRNLGVFSPDMLSQWYNQQYAGYDGFQTYLNNQGGYQGAGSAALFTGPPAGEILESYPEGCYTFPRFWNPGDLDGQGWLYTTNATKLTLEVASLASSTGACTIEIITDEVYPVMPTVPADLQEI